MMTAAEHYQQQLEQQEEEEQVVNLKDSEGREINVHIWGDDDTVFVNIKNWPISFTLYLEPKQAKKISDMMFNAARRAEK
jgi:hypothetical protein